MEQALTVTPVPNRAICGLNQAYLPGHFLPEICLRFALEDLPENYPADLPGLKVTRSIH